MTEREKQQIEEMAWGLCDIPTHPSITSCKECNNRHCHAMYYAERAYNAGYRKQSEGEWISVEERLPNKEDLERSQFHSFLVTNEFGEVREAVFTGKYFAKLGSRLSGVTHWMPLPEPPKMKGGTE